MDDGWISSNVPPADETLELVYNRGQLYVRRESYRLLVVVQLLVIEQLILLIPKFLYMMNETDIKLKLGF